MDAALSKVYFDVSHSAGFGSVKKLYDAVKPAFPELTFDYVSEWLSKQKSYSLLKPIRNNFKRNRVLVRGINEEFQADLLDVRNLASSNKNVTFLLTVIDVLSKYAYAIPLKRKTAAEVRQGFETIFKERVPSMVHTDDGKEFKGTLQALFQEFNVMHVISNDAKIKCSVAERFNKTLRLKIARYLRHTGKKQYIHVLPQIVASYNNSVHRSIGMKPIDVTISNQQQAFDKLYDNKTYREMLLETYRKQTKLELGDFVRRRINKSTFGRGYQDNWSLQLFRIAEIIQLGAKPMFRITDAMGSTLQQKYYQDDLQKITPTKHYIQTTGRKRNRGAKTEIEVIYEGTTTPVWIEDKSVFNDSK